jgi:hypothetical protein
MWMKGVLVVLLRSLLEPENVRHQGVVNVVYRAIFELGVLIAVKLSLIKNIKNCVVGNSFKFDKYLYF